MMAMMIMMATGTAYRSMGAIAETWTAGELRPLRRHGWRVINHFSLSVGDTDHVLIGPAGVIAIETKWSSQPWVLNPPSEEVHRAIVQVQKNAKQLRLWEGLKSSGVAHVETVLLLWGSTNTPESRAAASTVIDGTTVLSGIAAVRAWRATLLATNATMTREQRDAVWRSIDRQLHTRDSFDAVRRTSRPSLFEVCWQISGILLAVFASVFGFLEAVQLKPVAFAVIAVMAMGSAGLVARRLKRTRFLALGWLTALCTCLIAVGCWAAISHLR